MVKTVREAFLIYLKGFLMGCADSVPGVSGGTIALITGIYNRMISAITSLNKENISRFLRSLTAKERPESEIIFLLVLGSGVLSAMLLTLNLMHFMISNYLVITYSFFIGLISASIIALKDKVSLNNWKRRSALVAGFTIAFILSGYSTLAVNHGGLMLFLSGAVAVTAMVLPGISGSLILLLLGQYEYITGLVSEFTVSVSNSVSGGIFPVLESMKPLIIFASGGFIGLFTAAKTVEKALERDKKTTLSFLVGMVAGSLRAPVLRISQNLASENIRWMETAPEALLLSLIGVGVVVLINSISNNQDF